MEDMVRIWTWQGCGGLLRILFPETGCLHQPLRALLEKVLLATATQIPRSFSAIW